MQIRGFNADEATTMAGFRRFKSLVRVKKQAKKPTEKGVLASLLLDC